MDARIDVWFVWLARGTAGVRKTLIASLGLLAVQALPLAAIVTIVYVVFILPEVR